MPDLQTPSPSSSPSPAYSVAEFMNDLGKAPDPSPPESTPQDSDLDVSPPAPEEKRPSRDMEGLPEEDVHLFRAMSNDAFAKLKPAYIDYLGLKKSAETKQKDLDAARDLRWYEDPNAWQLHPEVRQHQQVLENLSFEHNFWKDQLAEVRAGKPYKELLVDDKGNYSTSEPIEASPRAEAEIISKLNQSQLYQQNVEGKIRGLQGDFKSKHDGLLSILQRVDSMLFPGVDWKKLDAPYKEALEKFPSLFQARPEIQMLAKALVIINGLGALLNQYKTGVKQKAIESQGPVSVQVSSNPVGEDPNLWNAFSKLTGGR